MNRREQYLERIAVAPINRKIRAVKVMEKCDMLDPEYIGVSSIIDNIAKVLNETCKENWDIIFVKNFENQELKMGWRKIQPFTIEFVIHYPEIIITNKNHQSHTIRDLYVKLLPFQSGRGFTFFNFKGKRMSATRQEVVSEYQHSHLPGRKYTQTNDNDSAFDWRPFCLGSSEIQQVLTMLLGGYEEGKFKLLMLQLEEYLNYESIEGNPYKRIANVIGGGKMTVLNSSECGLYYRDLIKRYNIGSLEPKKIDFKLEGNKVVIVDNDKFEQFLKKSENPEVYRHSNIAQKDEKGNYFGYRNIPREISFRILIKPEDYYSIEFFFREELVSFKLIEEQEYREEPFFINKYIKDYVRTTIEERIETKRFSSYIIEQLNTPTYLTRNTGQDNVFMSENT